MMRWMVVVELVVVDMDVVVVVWRLPLRPSNTLVV